MRLRPAVFAATVVTALVVTLVGVPAQAGDDLKERKRRADAQVAQLEQHVDEVSAAYVAALGRLKAVEAKLAPARAVVAAARGQLAAAKAREAALAERLRLAEAQVDKAERELAQVEADIESTQRDLGRLASNAYQEGAPTEFAAYIDADSIDEVLDRLAYSESAARSESALIRRLADARADVAARRATLEARRVEVAGLRDEAAKNVVAKKALEAQALAAQRRVEQLVAEAKAAADAIAAERAAELVRIAAAKADSARIGRLLAQRAAAALAAARSAARARGSSLRVGPAPRGGSFLARPVDGPVTSPYGMRVHPVTGVYKLHDGTDFGAPCGTPVYAAAAGDVVEAGYSGAWGNRVVVDHGLVAGNGIGTAYNHLTTIVARSGSLRRGELVGYVGSTGYSTGCHLHFNVYVNGATVDPMGIL